MGEGKRGVNGNRIRLHQAGTIILATSSLSSHGAQVLINVSLSERIKTISAEGHKNDSSQRTCYSDFLVGFSAPLTMPHLNKKTITHFSVPGALDLVITAYNCWAFLTSNLGPILTTLDFNSRL